MTEDIMRSLAIVALSILVLAACGNGGGGAEVGEFKNDLAGNEIKVEGLRDPEVPNVVCHIAYFDRGLWDRLGKGNWFEDPSNSAIECHRFGPITLEAARIDKAGEEVFSKRQSLFLKNVAVRRIIDVENRSILYVAYARELIDGSAKMSISTVPLTESEVESLQR
jgi:CreA protein